MDKFENIAIKGIHASRYIASYIRVGGTISKRAGQSDFKDWLKSLPLGLSEEEMDHIVELAVNGKMEFEDHARKFLKNLEESKR